MYYSRTATYSLGASSPQITRSSSPSESVHIVISILFQNYDLQVLRLQTPDYTIWQLFQIKLISYIRSKPQIARSGSSSQVKHFLIEPLIKFYVAIYIINACITRSTNSGSPYQVYYLSFDI